MAGYYRRVIRITADDSPNVRDPQANYPGLLTVEELRHRRLTWDKVRQCVGLDAQFYKGAALLLWPQEWLNRCHSKDFRDRCLGWPAEAIGVDPGEGVANTSLCAVNRFGIKELLSARTPDTASIPGEVLAFMKKHGVPPEKVAFDRGGGGKQHADRMKAMGYKVSTVAFGGHPELEMKRGLHMLESRKQVHDEQYQYLNMRAQMYHEASLCCDPSGWVNGFPTVMETVEGLTNRELVEDAISGLARGIQQAPGETVEEWRIRRARLEGQKVIANVGFYIPPPDDEPYVRLRQQLAVMPRLTDQEGRFWMYPKDVKDKTDPTRANTPTLVKLIGHSPDEADSFVVGVHRMIHKAFRARAGAA
jgi:hypothetical protein